MYVLMWVIVILFAIIGFLDRKYDTVLFKIEFCLMTLALVFRYGQGTDYFGYSMDYLDIPSKLDFHYLFHNDNHGEVGFLFVCEIFKSFGCTFVIFACIFALITMILVYKGIRNIPEYKTVSLLLFFPTYYCTFCYSAIRQGFVIAIVLSISIPALLEEKKAKYIVSVIIGSLFHSSVLILFLIPIGLKIFKRNKKTCLIFSVLCGFILAILLRVFGIKYGYYIYYSPSYAAIIIRVIMLLIMTRMYKVAGKNDDTINLAYNYYFLGICIFFALSAMSFISNRITIYFKECEVILFPMLLTKLRIDNRFIHISEIVRRRVVCCLLLICLVETGKNLESYVRQGEYNEGIHFYNYPYVSIFDKHNIFKYRDDLYNRYGVEVFGDAYWRY